MSTKIPAGTKVQAVLGETKIVGTVEHLGSSFPLTSVLIEGAHGAYLDCWESDGWKIEALELVGA